MSYSVVLVVFEPKPRISVWWRGGACGMLRIQPTPEGPGSEAYTGYRPALWHRLGYERKSVGAYVGLPDSEESSPDASSLILFTEPDYSVFRVPSELRDDFRALIQMAMRSSSVETLALYAEPAYSFVGTPPIQKYTDYRVREMGIEEFWRFNDDGWLHPEEIFILSG
jgi:hypothetical protein